MTSENVRSRQELRYFFVTIGVRIEGHSRSCRGVELVKRLLVREDAVMICNSKRLDAVKESGNDYFPRYAIPTKFSAGVAVYRFLTQTILADPRRIAAAIRRVAVQVERRQARDALLEVPSKVKISAGIQVRMVVGLLALLVRAIVLHRGSSPHTTEAALRDAPRPLQHFDSSPKRLRQAALAGRRRIRPGRSLQTGMHHLGRNLHPRVDGLRLRIRAEVILLEGMETLVGAVVGCVVCKTSVIKLSRKRTTRGYRSLERNQEK